MCPNPTWSQFWVLIVNSSFSQLIITFTYLSANTLPNPWGSDLVLRYEGEDVACRKMWPLDVRVGVPWDTLSICHSLPVGPCKLIQCSHHVDNPGCRGPELSALYAVPSSFLATSGEVQFLLVPHWEVGELHEVALGVFTLLRFIAIFTWLFLNNEEQRHLFLQGKAHTWSILLLSILQLRILLNMRT